MQRSVLLFESAIKSKATRESYTGQLNRFLKWIKIKDADGLLQLKDSHIQEMVEDYLLYKRKIVSPNTIPTIFAALELFFSMNEKRINFKKIRRMFPAKVKKSGNKAWTRDNVEKILLSTTSLRNKAIIHLLASTGCRIGTIPDLRIRHISKMAECKAVLFYEDNSEEYYGFLTPEASLIMDAYITQRKNAGEIIDDESPLFRTHYRIGIAKPKPMTLYAVKSLMRYLVHESAKIKRSKNNNQSRYDVQIAHGLRKRFATIVKMRTDISFSVGERLLGHKAHLDPEYFDPTKENLFNEFKKIIPELIIDDNQRLEMKNQKLEQEKSELEKKTHEIENLKKRVEGLELGPEAREAAFTKEMLRLRGDGKGTILETLFYLWFEMRATEKEKRIIWKKLEQAKKEKKKIDISLFGESGELSFKNLRNNP